MTFRDLEIKLSHLWQVKIFDKKYILEKNVYKGVLISNVYLPSIVITEFS